jgi:hypothetical protein
MLHAPLLSARCVVIFYQYFTAFAAFVEAPSDDPNRQNHDSPPSALDKREVFGEENGADYRNKELNEAHYQSDSKTHQQKTFQFDWPVHCRINTATARLFLNRARAAGARG